MDSTPVQEFSAPAPIPEQQVTAATTTIISGSQTSTSAILSNSNEKNMTNVKMPLEMIQKNNEHHVALDLASSGVTGFDIRNPIQTGTGKSSSSSVTYWIKPESYASATLWSTVEVGPLYWLSLFVFAFSFMFGGFLSLLSLLFLGLLSSTGVVYTFPTKFSMPHTPNFIEIKSLFLFEIKGAPEAFLSYFLGVLILILGGWLSYQVLTNQKKCAKCWSYLWCSIIFWMAALMMAQGPQNALKAVNGRHATSILLRDPNYAYQQNIKGSVKYYQKYRCNGATLVNFFHNDDVMESVQNKEFCSALAALEFILCVMIFSVVIPLTGFAICWIQIGNNKVLSALKKIFRWSVKKKSTRIQDH